MRFISLDRLSSFKVAAAFVLAAFCVLPFADLSIVTHDPWGTLSQMAQGFLVPNFSAVDEIGRALLLTVMFAVAGVAAGATAGLLLAPFYELGPVRAVCIFLRSIHELFWALVLMQAIGIGALTGVLAIALPFAGIFAKVFSEYIQEADPRPSKALPPGVGILSRLAYAKLPLVLPQMRTYILYRLECGLRSSAVLGFIGLPTLGFQLDSFFRQGDYGAASAILIIYVVLIASIRLWMRWRLAPLWVLGSIITLALVPSPPMGQGALWRFLTIDIVPAPLRAGWDGVGFSTWFWDILSNQALPGLITTLICAQIALVLTGMIAMLGFGLLVRRVTGRAGQFVGHIGLVMLRSLPEYMLAYLFLQVFGPSMLPAIIALSLHNGAIIAHLLGRQAEGMVANLRPDSPRGIALLTYELVPRLFGQFLALCLYRWEIILRETAVMGLLGVATLGFFVDAAVSELRIDRVVVLLLVGALLIAAIDALSRVLRRHLGAQKFAISLEETKILGNAGKSEILNGSFSSKAR